MNSTSDPFRVDGKVALITGAGRGIGASCAQVLATAGASIIVSDIETNGGESVAQQIRESGAKAAFQFLDVTDESHWMAAVKAAHEAFGGLDIVVNNAGIDAMSPLEDTLLSEWQQVMRVDSDGVFLGVKHAIQAMKPGGLAGRGGSIINMASICSMVALQGAGSYSAAKAAVTQLTRTAAVECGKLGHGIRVNSVHPGVILTELAIEGIERAVREGVFSSVAEARATYRSQHPIGRLGEPEDIANAVLYLASDASSFVTGAQLVVDGGFTSV